MFRGALGEAEQIRRENSLPFPVLADEDGHAHRAFGAQASYKAVGMVFYIADRFGEVYSAHRTDETHPLPRVEEILFWVRFIELQSLNEGSRCGRRS